MKHKTETFTLALCIALFPPIWAVAAPYLHVSTGAVALICAGLFVTNGNKYEDGLKITIGFLLGDCWAYLALAVMNRLSWNQDAELFVTLFVMGGLAVILSALAERWIHCPSWLCGWAIGLTIMSPMDFSQIGTYPLQIGAAMIAGIWYVGVFADLVQKRLLRYFEKRKQ